MSETFTIQVSRSAFRLRGTATFKGDTYRYTAKNMADFDEAVVDGAMLDGVDAVEITTTVSDDAASAVDEISKAREVIEERLRERQSAVRKGVEALEADGWSRKDAARIVGVNVNALAGLIADDEGAGVHGISVLGEAPADIGSDAALVLGRWVRDGDALAREGEVRVSRLNSRVQALWSAATGYTPESDEDADDDEAETTGTDSGDTEDTTTDETTTTADVSDDETDPASDFVDDDTASADGTTA